MGRAIKIWQNKLEDYVKGLYFEQRKTINQISEIIEKEKKIIISREAVRRFLKANSCTPIQTKTL